MQMNHLVLVLVAVLIIIMVGSKIANYYWAKRNNLFKFEKSSTSSKSIRWYNRYLYRQYAIIALSLFAAFWFLAFRYIPLFFVGAQEGWLYGVGRLAGGTEQMLYNKGWSMVFSLDLCSILALVTPLILIFDRKDYISISIGHLSVLGALVTFFFTYPDLNNLPMTFHYLLFGVWDNSSDLPMAFLSHFWMLGFGLYFILWRRKYTLKDLKITVIIAAIYLIYVLIVTNSMQITSHATGLAKNDYFPIYPGFHPPYAIIVDIFGITEPNWPAASFAGWLFFALIVAGPIFGFNRLMHKFDVVENNNYKDWYYKIYNSRIESWIMTGNYNQPNFKLKD